MENKKVKVQGYFVDIISFEESLNKVNNLIKENKGAHIITINPEMIEKAKEDESFSKILNEADMSLPDAVGIKLALKFKGINQPTIPGVEFGAALIKICAENGFGVGFLGANEETLQEAIKIYKEKYPELNVVFARNGYFKTEDEYNILEELEKAQPKVLFVALGAPKQEFLIYKYKNTLKSTIMIGVGGSFDVWANKVQRAPMVFRKLNLEWFYRLITQPSRFNRMFPTLPLFLLHSILDCKNK